MTNSAFRETTGKGGLSQCLPQWQIGDVLIQVRLVRRTVLDHLTGLDVPTGSKFKGTDTNRSES